MSGWLGSGLSMRIRSKCGFVIYARFCGPTFVLLTKAEQIKGGN